MLNICLISREYPPETAWGGIGTYTYQLAHGLLDKGHNVHVICQALDVDKEYLDNGVDIHRITHKSFFPFKGKFREFGLRWEYSQSVYNKLKEVIDKYNIDIVEAPNFSGEGFIYSFHKKPPLVTRLHTHFSEVINFLGWDRTLDRRLSCWFENITILQSDLITCSTKAHAEFIARETGINADKINIVPLGVVLPDIQNGQQIAGNQNPVILFVGRLEKRKGIHILIQAARHVLEDVPNATFIIIGRDSFIDRNSVAFSGEKELSYKEQLIKMIPNEYQKNIQFLGYIPPEQLGEYYRLCDIFVAPSLYESFGLIYLEAMSYAKPVIACGVGGVPELIKDKINGILVPPTDVQALKDAIVGLIKNPLRRYALGKAAREHVERNFNRALMVDNTIDVYRKACSNRIFKK